MSNINKHYSSIIRSSKEVVSKYFTRENMDVESDNRNESLSKEFQESKKIKHGPKQSQVKLSVKSRTTKPRRKKIKGQKDIRTALKSMKHDMETFNKDFEQLCQQAGVADAEKLQLAIAVSESLKEVKQTSISNESDNEEQTTSQETRRRIKATLLEYGFKIPESRIHCRTIKKPRGCKRSSKLLQTSNDEKEQLIAYRYSQILFNFNNFKTPDNLETNHDAFLYSICTNHMYDRLKNNSLFYVKDIFEPTNHKVGGLLKDWSKIPGRPVSPCRISITQSITDLSFEQEDLDIILSGKLQTAKDTFSGKQICVVIDETSKTNINDCIELMKQTESNQLKVESAMRSGSPDLFEDDESIQENSKCAINMQKLEDSNFANYLKTNESSRLADSQANHESENILLYKSKDNVDKSSSQKTDISSNSRRKSDDFMDLTECVTCLPHNIAPTLSENTDYGCKESNLNTESDNRKDLINCGSISNSSSLNTQTKLDDFMDLTKCIRSHESAENIVDHIDLTQSYSENQKTLYQADAHMDLTQSTDSDDSTLPYINVGGINNQFELNHNDQESLEMNEIYQPGSCSIDDYHIEVCAEKSKEKSDEPRTLEVCSKESNVRLTKSSDESVFDDFVYSHSDSSSKDHIKSSSDNIDILDKSSESTECDYVDLTQPANSSVDSVINDEPKESKVCTDNFSISSLGKKDDVSIDYDELIVNNNQSCNNETNDVVIKSCSQLYTDDCDDIFEISDEELNYSMHRSKCNKENSLEELQNVEYEKQNCDIGTSLIDNKITDITTNSKRMRMSEIRSSTLSRSLSDSYLPAVEIKGTKVKIKSPMETSLSQGTTPIRNNINESIELNIETPRNNKDYLIKTINVTPMADYESMTTPERNKELEKFGIKPFKRKRAIQLLQHLYNQTHPIVESCDSTNISSPSKKFKAIANENVTNIPTTSKNCDAYVDKEIEIDVFSENNVIYEVTKEVPDIQELQDDSDDWVFQKREKSKIDSCRVPLHIVFHNYVSCRRRLQEAMLRYEPVSIDVIYKHLVSYGYRYDKKELLKFMDKKCITVKTMDNNGRNNKNKRF